MLNFGDLSKNKSTSYLRWQTGRGRLESGLIRPYFWLGWQRSQSAPGTRRPSHSQSNESPFSLHTNPVWYRGFTFGHWRGSRRYFFDSGQVTPSFTINKTEGLCDTVREGFYKSHPPEVKRCKDGTHDKILHREYIPTVLLPPTERGGPGCRGFVVFVGVDTLLGNPLRGGLRFKRTKDKSRNFINKISCLEVKT